MLPLQATVGCLLCMGAAMVQFRAPGEERGLPGEQSPAPHSSEELSDPPIE
ncbi:MAG: hypothetical protein HFE39_10425 [Clostridiales bacterium]|nr:hypothetical protein [Clostridiales bacterium]